MPTRYHPEGMDKIVREIRRTRGMATRIARHCGIERAAVYQWRRVPPHWVHEVAGLIDKTPEQIRPDIFRPRRSRA